MEMRLGLGWDGMRKTRVLGLDRDIAQSLILLMSILLGGVQVPELSPSKAVRNLPKFPNNSLMFCIPCSPKAKISLCKCLLGAGS